MIEQVLIENYKSIKDLSLPLNRLNVLIGSNGAGKSNFISFFELTKAIYEQRFGSYTLSSNPQLSSSASFLRLNVLSSLN